MEENSPVSIILDLLMEQEFRNCPICESDDIIFAFPSHKTYEGYDGFNIWRCRHCNVYFVNPQPMRDSLLQFYKAESGKINQWKDNNFKDYYEKEGRKIVYDEYFDSFHKIIPSGKILDIGCGRGEFVKLLQDHGYEAFGIDFLEDAIALGREIGTSNLSCCSLEDYYTDEKFNAILMLSIFEHLKEPKRMLSKLVSLLEDDGYIMLSVPYVGSLHYINFWEHAHWIMAPYHLFYYSFTSLKEVFDYAGLEIKHIIPAYHSEGWCEAIAYLLNIHNSFEMWGKDKDFQIFRKSVDSLFDKISIDVGRPSIIKLIAQKK